jgi:hypothetical protein
MSKQTVNKNQARGRGRRGPRGRNGQGMGKTQIPRHLKAYVNERMRVDLESKFIDVTLAASSVTATGTIGVLANIPQGIGQSQRIGDQVTLTRILANIDITAANSDVFSHARFIMFQWHPNVTLDSPTIANILQTPANTFYSMLNWQLSDQFTILYDKVWSLLGTSTVPTDKSDQIVFTTVLPRRKIVNWTAGSTSASSNTIFLLYISDSAGSPFPQIQFSIRMEYLDG